MKLTRVWMANLDSEMLRTLDFSNMSLTSCFDKCVNLISSFEMLDRLF